jgi:hypothetical protein
VSSVAVLTPFVDTAPIDLGNNMWRKQVIRHGDYDYKGRRLSFTPEYTAGLANAYRARAYDAVPFQFAPADNAHTNAVDATRGQLVDFAPTPDGSGLDGIFQLGDQANQVITENPNLPVSVRIVENLERADGAQFPAAVQHVLATWDPRITGMSGWQRVELSNAGVDHVLDLTTMTAAQKGHAVTTPTTTSPPPAASTQQAPVPGQAGAAGAPDQLSSDELARLRAILAAAPNPNSAQPGQTGQQGAAPGSVAQPTTQAPTTGPATGQTGDGWLRPSDADLDRIAAGILGGAPVQQAPAGQPAGPTVQQPGPAPTQPQQPTTGQPAAGQAPVQQPTSQPATGQTGSGQPQSPELANGPEHGQALELANQRADRMELELATIRNREAERDFADFRTQLANAGLSPNVTDLAKPLLIGGHHVELANGTQLDVADHVRKVLMAAAESKALDLSQPGAVMYPTQDAQAAAAAHQQQMNTWAASYAKEHGLL